MTANERQLGELEDRLVGRRKTAKVAERLGHYGKGAGCYDYGFGDDHTTVVQLKRRDVLERRASLHHHPVRDVIETFRDRSVSLSDGQCCGVPIDTEHRGTSRGGAEVVLFTQT